MRFLHMNDNQMTRNAKRVAAGVVSDWRNAYIIACSVEKGVGSGDRTDLVGPQTRSGKESGQAFARRIKEQANGSVYGMGVAGVLAAFAKWDEVAPQYGLPTSDQLTPEDADRDPAYPDRPWKGGDSGKGKVKDIAGNPGAVAEALRDPRFADKVAERASASAKQNVARTMVDQAALDAPDVKQRVRSEAAKHDRLELEAARPAPERHASIVDAADVVLAHGADAELAHRLRMAVDGWDRWLNHSPWATNPANAAVALRAVREQRLRLQAIELVLTGMDAGVTS